MRLTAAIGQPKKSIARLLHLPELFLLRDDIAGMIVDQFSQRTMLKGRREERILEKDAID
jgi:hypothetical protein